MTLGFLFGGQGSQLEGMGKDFVEQYDEIKQLYKQAEHLLGYDLLTLTQKQLNQTRYAQPAIYVFSCAIQHLLKQANIFPFATAGLSLGEYNALHCANSLSFETGLQLLQKRALFMEKACTMQSTSMAAVLTQDRQLVDTLCEHIRQHGDLVYPANYNSPGQIVVGGHIKGLERLKDCLLTHKIKRVIPLAVSGAFHTPFMQSAADNLSPFLKDTTFTKTDCIVISNTLATEVDYRQLPELLTRQIVKPVYFEDSIKKMMTLGVNCFIEIGPKAVLSKFVKKINKDSVICSISTVEQLQTAIQQFKQGGVYDINR